MVRNRLLLWGFPVSALGIPSSQQSPVGVLPTGTPSITRVALLPISESPYGFRPNHYPASIPSCFRGPDNSQPTACTRRASTDSGNQSDKFTNRLMRDLFPL